MKNKFLPLAIMIIAFAANSFEVNAQSPNRGNNGNYDDPPYYAKNEDRYGRDNNYYYDRRNNEHYSAQRAVRHQPTAPYYRRGPAPSPHHVWIDAEWTWNRGNYQFVPGYWSRPPARNMYYVAGRWERTRFGWVWINGYWMKGRGRMPYQANGRW